MTRHVAVLGSTGSVGQNTLAVMARHPDLFRCTGLAAHRSVQAFAHQCAQWRPRHAAMADGVCAAEVQALLANGSVDVRVQAGAAALVALASAPEVDTVMAAIVGSAGLASTLAAAQLGKRVLLANKESLVMAGELLMGAARSSGAEILPIDSEHNAIFQCLPGEAQRGGVRRILLTASGGPFRTWSTAEMADVTPEQACAHPNWRMGPKISVDSATMMNKGLELIEACHLFAVTPAQVEIVVHRESIVHSMVEYVDGSVLAQLGEPDMRTPIAYGLAWPNRIDSGVTALDLVARGQLNFEAPDEMRFPALRLARRAAEAAGTAPIVLNAANEVAVQAFLTGRARFLDIPGIIAAALDAVPVTSVSCLADVLEADRRARSAAGQLIQPH